MSAHARVVRSVLRDYFEEYGSAKEEAQTMACLDELVAENQRLRDALTDLGALTFENEDDEKVVRSIIAAALDGPK